MNRTASHLILLCVLTMVVLLSCATVHETTIRPVSIDQPVSASSSILTRDGQTLDWYRDFDVISEFEFPVTLEGLVARNTIDEIDLSDRLEELIREAGGDGIIHLEIAATSYDSGPTIGVGAAKTVGTFSGMAGVMMLLAGAIWDVDVLYITGGVFSGIGALGWGTGLALQYTGHTELTFTVSGDVIKLMGE
jgi:hypothetical protein